MRSSARRPFDNNDCFLSGILAYFLNVHLEFREQIIIWNCVFCMLFWDSSASMAVSHICTGQLKR